MTCLRSYANQVADPPQGDSAKQYEYSLRSKIVGFCMVNDMIGRQRFATKPHVSSLILEPDREKERGKVFKNDQYEMKELGAVSLSAAFKSALDR